MTKMAEDVNIDMEILDSVDERRKSSFWYGFATNYVFDKDNLMPISPEDNLFLKQCKCIEEISENENCIVVGRCADFILKDRPNVIKIFVYSSNLQFKVDRKMKFDNCSEEEAKEKIKIIDKQRSDYYNHFTSLKWGDKTNYDLCVDTSSLGTDASVDIILSYVKNYLKLKGEKKHEKE